MLFLPVDALPSTTTANTRGPSPGKRHLAQVSAPSTEKQQTYNELSRAGLELKSLPNINSYHSDKIVCTLQALNESLVINREGIEAGT